MDGKTNGLPEYTCKIAWQCPLAGQHQACTYSDGSRCSVVTMGLKQGDEMPVNYGPCDKCGDVIKPCRCTLLAERDALTEYTAQLRSLVRDKMANHAERYCRNQNVCPWCRRAKEVLDSQPGKGGR